MEKLLSDIEGLEGQLFQLKLQKVIQEAYERGIEDGRSKYYYPMVLKKSDLAEILQVKEVTVNKIVADPKFPRLRSVQARYPRDEVFAWIYENTERLDQLLS